jgi:acylphosphatase
MKARAHVLISGRVQGVFFRSQAQEEAESRGVKGWIRNVSDGTVEAVFEGEKEAVDALIEFCKRGPAGARVTKVELKWENYTGEFVEFRIRYG